MIKFFRKIRQNLLSQNKIVKYLLYAFGEIILVIIGILIALSLNKKAEQKQAEAKVDAILEDVMKELENDISQGTLLIYEYRFDDSLSSLVLNNKVTVDDYTATGKNSWRIGRLATGWVNYEISDDAYNLLIDNIDAIPDDYSKAIASLKWLNNYLKPDVIEFNALVKTLVNKNYDDYQENYEWYGKIDSISEMEEIDYMLNNYDYKNKVRRQRDEAIITHRSTITDYREGAVIAYKEIAKALNKSIDTLNFIVTQEALKNHVGTYTNIDKSEDSIELVLKEGYLDLTKPSDDRVIPMFPLDSENNFYLDFHGLVRFRSSDNGDFITVYRGHIARTYTKTD